MGRKSVEVKAVFVEDIDENDTPGAIEFGVIDGEPCGLLFNCPCGCGRKGYLPFKPEPSPSWEWNKDKKKPSLRPSIKQVGGCQWHGYLTDGVFKSC